jgi:hypothetical protein
VSEGLRGGRLRLEADLLLGLHRLPEMNTQRCLAVFWHYPAAFGSIRVQSNILFFRLLVFGVTPPAVFETPPDCTHSVAVRVCTPRI